MTLRVGSDIFFATCVCMPYHDTAAERVSVDSDAMAQLESIRANNTKLFFTNMFVRICFIYIGSFIWYGSVDRLVALLGLVV